MEYVERAKQTLDRLFTEKMVGEVENCTADDVKKIEDFFKSNEKDICKFLGLRRPKPNIPEKPDCKLVACVNNEKWIAGYILSADGHFIGYKPELHDNFNIRILPQTDLIQIMSAWKWRK